MRLRLFGLFLPLLHGASTSANLGPVAPLGAVGRAGVGERGLQVAPQRQKPREVEEQGPRDRGLQQPMIGQITRDVKAQDDANGKP